MTKKELIDNINSDLHRYCGNILKKNLFRYKIKNPGFSYMYTLRKCQYYKKNKILYRLYRYILGKKTYKYGYEIPPETKIGRGLYINHIGGIAINKETIIGCNCNITKGVTIGQTNRGIKKGAPIIGNKVWIGSNASIVGKIIIGDNVLIAPNAYVNFDVPSNSVVVGNPGKIIQNKNATSEYINNILHLN